MLSLTMELRAAAVLLLFLFAIIIITTEGLIPKCCLETSATVDTNMLKRAQKYDMQSETGPCELKALVLYVGKQRFCFGPNLEKKVKRWMKRKKYQHSNKQNKQ